MLGVQNQRDIHRLRPALEGFSPRSIHENVAGQRKRRIGLDRLLPAGKAMPGRQDHGQLREQPFGLAQIGVVAVVICIGIPMR